MGRVRVAKPIGGAALTRLALLGTLSRKRR